MAIAGHMLVLLSLAAAPLALPGCDGSGAGGAGPPPRGRRDASTGADAGPAHPPDPPVAEVERSVGDVRWQAAATAAWAPAGVGLDLRPDDTIQTMEAGLADLRFLGSGGTARLGPGTTLRVPRQERSVARLRHLRGPLLARLGSGGDASHMEVELPAGTLLLDTPPDAGPEAAPSIVEAQVDVSDERTEVAMIRGSGTLARTSGQPLRIEEEHFVEVGGDGRLLDSGRLGPIVQLASPEDGARVRTRGDVDLSWRPAERVAGYLLAVWREGGERRETRLGAARTSTRLALPSGRHLWTVHALVGEQRAQASLPWSVEVEVDESPPALDVTSPVPGVTVRGAELLVSGRTEPGATVTVDGRPVPVDPDGSFSVEHRIERGLVNVVVRATDDLGNARAVSRAVLRE